MAGWGATFLDQNLTSAQPQYDSVIGQAELKWYVSASPGVGATSDLGLALSSVALGYTRDFSTSFLGNYYGSDRGYLKFSYFFAGRALVTLEGGVAAIEYPDMFFGPSGMPRVEAHRLHGRAPRRDALRRVPVHRFARAQHDDPLHGELQQQPRSPTRRCRRRPGGTPCLGSSTCPGTASRRISAFAGSCKLRGRLCSSPAMRADPRATNRHSPWPCVFSRCCSPLPFSSAVRGPTLARRTCLRPRSAPS